MFDQIHYILGKDRNYTSDAKRKLRSYLIDKYIMPKVKKGKEVSVLDFFGTGQFVEQVIKRLENHKSFVNNQKGFVNLFEIEQDNKLQDYMKGFVDQIRAVKNHESSVSITPFYGSLAEFVHKADVKNHWTIDLLWLDYCGMVEEKDITVVEPLVNTNTAIVLTVDLNVMEVHKRKTLERVDNMMENVFRKTFPLFRVQRIRSYKRMVVYEARVPYYIRKLQAPKFLCAEPTYKCEEVITYGKTERIVEIPSFRSLGIS